MCGKQSVTEAAKLVSISPCPHSGFLLGPSSFGQLGDGTKVNVEFMEDKVKLTRNKTKPSLNRPFSPCLTGICLRPALRGCFEGAPTHGASTRQMFELFLIILLSPRPCWIESHEGVWPSPPNKLTEALCCNPHTVAQSQPHCSNITRIDRAVVLA